MELSIVMPCLNEELTVGICIDKAVASLAEMDIEGEVVIADNNSTDHSREVAERHGARVVRVAEKGYGAALMAGIRAAQGTYVIMGDADDSYDFTNLAPFIDRLRDGYNLVLGNRFKGGIKPGAMPLLHRYLGNPILSFLGRLFFRASVGDFHCGLRGFNRQRMLDLDLNCRGMEFASEMVVKASLAKYRIAEVPTTLQPDGRGRAPHLNSWRDGWRHLRFLLLFSPRWLFFYPGLVAFILGMLLTTALGIGPVHVGDVVFDVHTLLYGAAVMIIGLQMVFFAVLIQLIGSGFRRLPETSGRLLTYFTLEKGIALGLLAVVVGLFWSASAVWQWGQADFANLDPRVTMRHTIPAVAMLISGIQIVISSFFLSAIQLYTETRS